MLPDRSAFHGTRAGHHLFQQLRGVKESLSETRVAQVVDEDRMPRAMSGGKPAQLPIDVGVKVVCPGFWTPGIDRMQQGHGDGEGVVIR